MNLSAVILAKNEERNISECIKSLDFCDEVILIDDFSLDKTRQLALSHGANIFKRKLNNDFASQRNFGLKKAKGKWVLFVDADERVTPRLRGEIIQTVDNPFIKYSGFYLKRKDFIAGKEISYGEMGKIKILRLAKKDSGFWQRNVHESWIIKGKTQTLVNPIFHYPHRNLRNFLDSINQFSSLHALANRNEGKSSNIIKITIWPLGHFVNNWIFKKGFLDGTLGFAIAIVMSFHSFLAWAKLWFLQKRQYTKV